MSSSVADAEKFEPEQRIKVEMSDLTDGKNFYLRRADSDDAQKIDEAMENFDPSTADTM